MLTKVEWESCLNLGGWQLFSCSVTIDWVWFTEAHTYNGKMLMISNISAYRLPFIVAMDR